MIFITDQPPREPKKKTKEKKIAPPSGLALVTKGETPKEQEENRKKIEDTKKKVGKEAKERGAQKGAAKAEQQKIDEEKSKVQEKDKEEKWHKGTQAIDQALAYGEKTGVSWDELNTILKKIQKRPEFGFKELYAKDEEKEYGIYASMSSAKRQRGIPKKPRGEIIKKYEQIDPKTGKT